MTWKNTFLVLCLAAVAPARAGSPAFNELLAAGGGAVPAVVAPSPSPAASAVPPTSESAPVLPNEFVIHERAISLTDTFDLKEGSSSFGTITEKFFSLTKSFSYVDASGRCVAKARARLLSWGTHIDVTDCADRPVGAIKENILKSLFKVYTTYSILDANGREIAISEKVQWISTDLVLRRPGGAPVAELHRPWLNFLSDNWNVKIRDHAAVDARLIVLIAAYKTSVDNDRRNEESRKSSDK